MRIALCYIVKDDSEVEQLKNSIISAIDYIDSLHIVANGEKTTDIESLTAFTLDKYPQKLVTYDYLKWNDDFAEQRNFVATKIPTNTDYYLWMDTDDVLIGGKHLKKIAQLAKMKKMDTVFLKYWYGCEFNGKPSEQTLVNVDIEHFRERLLKPGTSTWKKRIHETPIPVDGVRENYAKIPYSEDTPIAIMHTTSLDDSQAKMDRNQKILELELSDERKQGKPDPRTILYLMKIYAERGDKQTLINCIEMGHEYLGLSGWDEERANALDIMAICSSKLNHYAEAITYLHRAIEEYPHDPLHYVRLALAYFNHGKNKEAKHWLEMAGQMKIDDATAGIRNIKELKVLFAQLALKIAFNVDKDLKKSLESAKLLYEEQPTPENEENINHIEDRLALYNASEAAKTLTDYLSDIGSDSVSKIIDTLPVVLKEQPWAIATRQKNTTPRIWKDNEICYFANFGGKHFEKWGLDSLDKGIGGSETAVIQLSMYWASQGYKVTIYGDPSEAQRSEFDNGGSVTVLPWYHFNKGDKHNIFIQWRSGSLAPVVKAKKFYIDLHDMVAQIDYPREIISAIDGVFFKSDYHRSLLPELPDNKAIVIGNGINE